MIDFDEEEFAKKAIQNFLNGERVSEWAWDDFISEPIRDKYVRSIQSICASLPIRFPPELGTGYYCNESGVNILRIIQENFFSGER